MQEIKAFRTSNGLVFEDKKAAVANEYYTKLRNLLQRQETGYYTGCNGGGAYSSSVIREADILKEARQVIRILTDYLSDMHDV